jgi:septal ring factor EnvC (AmiA/AmiB activator)
MEAIAAFGLACNVIQVVSFGLEVASKSKEIQQKGSTIEVQDYEDTSKELADVINALDSSIKNAPSPLTKDDHDLQALSRNCSKAATDLQAELQKLSARNQRRRGTLSKTLITLTRGGAIQGLHKRLREYERVLNTRLLVRLRYATEFIMRV